MRKETPSRNWMRRAIDSYDQHGGWCGPATMVHARRELTDLYQRGVSANAAGYVAAKLYRLHSSLEFWREAAE